MYRSMLVSPGLFNRNRVPEETSSFKPQWGNGY